MGDLPHAHNGYLDIILEYGFVGLFLVSMLVLSSCRNAHSMLRYDFFWGSFWVCFLIMSLIRNIAEGSLTSFVTQPMAIILFLYVASAANSNSRPVTEKCTRYVDERPG
jgi:O-antigen ligase